MCRSLVHSPAVTCAPAGEERVTIGKQFEQAVLSSTLTWERFGQLMVKVIYAWDDTGVRYSAPACNGSGGEGVPAWARDAGLLLRANASQPEIRNGVGGWVEAGGSTRLGRTCLSSPISKIPN